MGKLPLGQGIEHVALIFVLIQPGFQKNPPRSLVPLHPGIVACSHLVKARFRRPPEQLSKLDVPVAVDAGVRGFSLAIGVYKAVYHLFPEILLEVEHIKGNPQAGAHHARVIYVVC